MDDKVVQVLLVPGIVSQDMVPLLISSDSDRPQASSEGQGSIRTLFPDTFSARHRMSWASGLRVRKATSRLLAGDDDGVGSLSLVIG